MDTVTIKFTYASMYAGQFRITEFAGSLQLTSIIRQQRCVHNIITLLLDRWPWLVMV